MDNQITQMGNQGPNNTIGLAILQTIVQAINALSLKTNPSKIVEQGTIAGTKGTIYTATNPEEKITYLHLYHANATPQVVNVYLNIGGTSRQYSRDTINQYGDLDVFSGIFLNEGDTIEADSTTADAVLFVLGGEIVTMTGV